MKAGLTINELATQVMQQREISRDFVAPTTAVEFYPASTSEDPVHLLLHGEETETLAVNRYAHQQISAWSPMPWKYYEKVMQANPDLLAANMNYWLQQSGDKRLIRALGNSARAWLSDRYRTLDNYDLLQAVVPKLRDVGCELKSCEITERRMYIKCVFPQLEDWIGDHVEDNRVFGGLVISNSEVGSGALKVEPLIYRLVCSNGMIANLGKMSRYHIGKALGGDDGGVEQFFTDDTKKKDDDAFFAKVGDTVDALTTPEVFREITGQLKEAAGEKLEDPVKVVEVTREKLQLSDDENRGVLEHLVQGGDLTTWGLVNAVTRTSQDVPDYDRATELERGAWDLIQSSN